MIDGFDRVIHLGVLKIKKYPKFTLYKVFKKQGRVFVPIYNTTLTQDELKKYEILKEMD